MRDVKNLPGFGFPGSCQPHFRLRSESFRSVEIEVDGAGGGVGVLVADAMEERGTDEQVLKSVAVDVGRGQGVAEAKRLEKQFYSFLFFLPHIALVSVFASQMSSAVQVDNSNIGGP